MNRQIVLRTRGLLGTEPAGQSHCREVVDTGFEPTQRRLDRVLPRPGLRTE